MLPCRAVMRDIVKCGKQETNPAHPFPEGKGEDRVLLCLKERKSEVPCRVGTARLESNLKGKSGL